MANKSEKGVILLVDDEAIIRDSLRQWLEMEDFHVLTAANGEEALQICKTEYLDVGVFDIRMPGMDGITLLSHVKNHCPNFAVIMMTAFASIEDAVRCISQGAYDYIIKPFPPEKLTQTIHHIMETRQLRHERQRTSSKKQFVAHYLNNAQSFLSLGIAAALLSDVRWADSDALRALRAQPDERSAILIQQSLFGSQDVFTTHTCTLKQLFESTTTIIEMQSDLSLNLSCQVQDNSTQHKFPIAPASFAIQRIALYLLQHPDTKNHLVFREQASAGQSKIVQLLSPAILPEDARHALTTEPSLDKSDPMQLNWAQSILKALGIDIEVDTTSQSTIINFHFSK